MNDQTCEDAQVGKISTDVPVSTSVQPPVLPSEYFDGMRERGLKGFEGLDFLIKRLDEAQVIDFLTKDKHIKTSLPEDIRNGAEAFLRGRKLPLITDIACGDANILRDLSLLNIPDLQMRAVDFYKPQNLPPKAVFVQQDLNTTLQVPVSDSDLTVCLFGLRYLADPLSLINQMVSATKPGGYVVFNGAKAMHIDLTPDQSYSTRSVSLFSDYIDIDPQRLLIYANPLSSLAEDIVLLKVLDPAYRFNCSLIPEKSVTAATAESNYFHNYRDIQNLSNFIYRKN